MSRILIQYKHYKFLYNNESSLEDIRQYITEDVKQLCDTDITSAITNIDQHFNKYDNQISHEYELVFVDQHNGDWLVVQSQADFNNISRIAKNQPILLKFLPKNQYYQQKLGQNQVSPNKFEIIPQIIKFGQELTKKYLAKMTLHLTKQQQGSSDRCLKNNNKIDQGQAVSRNVKGPKCKKIADISQITISNISQSIENKRRDYSVDIECLKLNRKVKSSQSGNDTSLQKLIESVLKQKISQIVPQIMNMVMNNLSSSTEQCNSSEWCNSSYHRDDSLHRIINTNLIHKLKSQNKQL